MHFLFRRLLGFGGIVVMLALFGAKYVAVAATECPLNPLQAYKIPGNPSVYYISEDCKKRPIRNPQVYFSHFVSWADVRLTNAQTLNRIPDHELSFLPWGPRRVYPNGSLLKTVTDPKVYLLLGNNTLHAIGSEDAFLRVLGYQFNQIEDVAPSVLQKYSTGTSITSAATLPANLLFKYANDPKVYATEVVSSTTGTAQIIEKRYITSEQEVKQVYGFRIDHVAIIPQTALFTDVSGARPPQSPPASPTPPPAAPGAPTVVITSPTDGANFSFATTITLQATALDPNGIASVNFYDGTTLLGQDTTAPYTFTWRDAARGAHVVTAKAKDTTGVEGASAAVTLSVTVGGAAGGATPPPATPPPAAPVPNPTPTTPNPPPPSPTTPSPSPTTPSPSPTTPPPAPSPAPSGSLANYRSAIGSNMHSLIDFGANWIYVDLFKSSRPWASGNSNGDCWDCVSGLDLDANGWVRSLQTTRAGGHVARAAIITNVTGSTNPSTFYQTGRYTVLYDGDGTITYSGGNRNADLSRAGRDVVDVTNSGIDTSLILEIRVTNPSNYIRNIRVYPPGGSCSNDQTQYCTTNSQCSSGGTCQIFADTTNPQLLHPTYLRNNRSTAVVRFMQEWGINEVGIENVRNPSDLTALNSAQWFRTPPEIIGQIGNILQTDVWINIPVNASDALIRDIATRLRSTLNTNSRVFVEYSNESWNGAYPYILQQQILAARGCQNNPDLQAECDQDNTPGNGIYCEGHPWPLRYIPACGTGEMREFSTRSVQAGQIFRDVFGANGRVVRVMGSFTGSTWRTGNLLSWRNAYQNIDAVATAPYFGNSISGDSSAQTMSLTQLFSYLTDVSLPAAFREINDDVTYLRQNYPGIDLIAYEGGQHLVAYGANENNAAAQRLFQDANNDPRMGTLYTQYLQGWRDRGGKTFAHFVDVTPQTRYGNFGALLSQNQPHSEAPKFRALENFALETPCWWTGCEFGGSWVGRGGSGGTSPSPSPTPSPSPSPTPNPTPSPSPSTSNVPPTVSLTAPTNGSTYAAPASITLNATAGDSDGTIARVEFYNGSTLLGQDTTSPYSYSWTNVAAGTYSVTARAIDSSSAQTNSSAVTVTVNTVVSSQGSTSTPVLNLIESAGYGYWTNTNNQTFRILFSQQNDPTLYAAGVTAYDRPAGFNEVYIQRSQLNMPTGTIYLRLCVYNQATDSCTGYSASVPYNGTN